MEGDERPLVQIMNIFITFKDRYLVLIAAIVITLVLTYSLYSASTPLGHGIRLCLGGVIVLLLLGAFATFEYLTKRE